MTKTAKQIVGDIIELIKGSRLEAAVSGKIYRGNKGKSYRPAGSKKEDIVVYHTTGDPSQMQQGVVTVNIYVPDTAYEDSYAENGKRSEEVEILAQEWASSLTADKSDYRLKLMQTIYTEAEPEINQHFVVVKLKYDLLTN